MAAVGAMIGESSYVESLLGKNDTSDTGSSLSSGGRCMFGGVRGE